MMQPSPRAASAKWPFRASNCATGKAVSTRSDVRASHSVLCVTGPRSFRRRQLPERARRHVLITEPCNTTRATLLGKP